MTESQRGGIVKRSVSPKIKQVLLCVFPGFIATVIVLFTYMLQPEFIKRMDLRIYDRFLAYAAGGEPSEVPILIDIDEKSLFQYGQWPWARYLFADLLAKLCDGEIAAIGIDILTPTEDRTSPRLLVDQLSRDFGVEISPDAFPKELYDNDMILADVLRQVPAVLSCYVADISEEVPPPLIEPPKIRLVESRAAGAPTLAESLVIGDGIIMPLRILAEAGRGIGAMNAGGDYDGIFRRAPLFMSWKGKIVPGLALATLALAYGGGERAIQLLVKMDIDGPKSLKLGDIEIPMSHDGTLPIMFRSAKIGRSSFPVYSAADIMQGLISSDLLRGRVAFIGSTTSGLKDLRPTPFDNNYPGLELHAALVDTILSKRFVVIPPWIPGAEFLITGGVGLISVLLFSLASPLIYLSLMGFGMLGIWEGAAWLFTHEGIYFSPSYPFIAIVLSSFLTLGTRFWLEDKNKRVLKKAFSNYVSPEIVSQIMHNGSVASLQGESREVTIMFTDIRGFTSLTEKLQPTQVVEMLGRYFTPMTALVRESGGTLDKFVGDAMMAFWNAPIDVDEHPRRAIAALLDMHDKLAELNIGLEADMGIRLRMGGGVHTGTAQVGNMGTADLMNYTAIGDTVNTASRVEGMCSKYGFGAVVSGDTRFLCIDKFAWQRIDTVRVKGRMQGVQLWSPMRFEEANNRRDELDLWAEAFSLYEDGKFADSHKICKILHEKFEEFKLYQIFEQRTLSLMKDIPADWDGILKYESK